MDLPPSHNCLWNRGPGDHHAQLLDLPRVHHQSDQPAHHGGAQVSLALYCWLCYISRYGRTDSRLPALVSLVDVVEMPGLDQEEEEEAPPPVLVVASTGPSAEEYDDCMGEYRLTEQRSAGRAVYKHCTRERYIYSDPRSGYWLVGSTVGKAAAFLQNQNSSSDCPPQTGWWYGDIAIGGWAADPDLSVMPAPASQSQSE